MEDKVEFEIRCVATCSNGYGLITPETAKPFCKMCKAEGTADCPASWDANSNGGEMVPGTITC